MPGGRPRKSIEQHLSNGNYRPSRHGPKPDEDDGTAPPPVKPDGLNTVASEMWDCLTRMLVGVVRDRDAAVLQQMVRWWSRWQDLEKALDTKAPGSKGYNALLIATGIASDKFDRLGSRFGLTPADRAKLKAEKPVHVKPKVMTRQPTKLDQAGPPPAAKRGKK